MSESLAHTALLLIDIQQGFNHPTHWGLKRSNPAFEANIATILRLFRAAKTPTIIHVCHHSTSNSSPLHPSGPGVAFQPYAAPLPSEKVVSKSVNAAFLGTDLEQTLRERQITRLFVCGLMVDHCVSSTIKLAANLGVVSPVGAAWEFEKPETGGIILLEDATAAYSKGRFDAETVHGVNVESLRKEFCEVMTLDEAIKELGL